MSKNKGPKTAMNADGQITLPEPVSTDSHIPLPLELQGAIGKQLKHVYGQVLAEPMPDRFAQLLETLSKSEK